MPPTEGQAPRAAKPLGEIRRRKLLYQVGATNWSCDGSSRCEVGVGSRGLVGVATPIDRGEGDSMTERAMVCWIEMDSGCPRPEGNL
jgi:hypothetical protein